MSNPTTPTDPTATGEDPGAGDTTHNTDTAHGTESDTDRGTSTVSTGTARPRNVWPLVAAVLLMILTMVAFYFVWQSRQADQVEKDKPLGNASSKSALSSAKSTGSDESKRRLGADSEDSPDAGDPNAVAPVKKATPVPAIERDLNGGPTGAAPIPVQGQQGQTTPPRSRFDAPSSFDGTDPGRSPYNTASANTGTPTATRSRTSTTGPDYSVPASGNPPTFAPLDRSALNLSTTKTPTALAAMIGNRDFILPKGAFVDCDLDTAINSTVPGMVRCTTTKDAYSDSGRVVLIGRGSTVTGEYRSDVQTGQARIQIIWSRIKTPEGVVIEPASPASDSLGRGGIDGEVDNHWFERIGSAFMLSLIKDAIAYATATNGTSASTGVAYQNTSQSGDQMSTQILKQTINIPPTITRNQGTRVKIFLARDLDFSAVYSLKVAP